MKYLFTSIFIFSFGAQALPDLPSQETYQVDGVTITIDPRPHDQDKVGVYSRYRNHDEEFQLKFLKARRELLDKTFEQLSSKPFLTRVMSMLGNWRTPTADKFLKSARLLDVEEYYHDEAVIDTLQNSMQSVSNLLWRSFEVVAEPKYSGWSISLLVTTGVNFNWLGKPVSKLSNDSLRKLGTAISNVKFYRGIGLKITVLTDLRTGEIHPVVSLDSERLDPNGLLNFFPVNLSGTMRLQKIKSQVAQAAADYRGITFFMLPVASNSWDFYSSGIHLGLNLLYSPITAGALIWYFTGKVGYLAFLAPASPIFMALGALETITYFGHSLMSIDKNHFRMGKSVYKIFEDEGPQDEKPPDTVQTAAPNRCTSYFAE